MLKEKQDQNSSETLGSVTGHTRRKHDSPPKQK